MRSADGHAVFRATESVLARLPGGEPAQILVERMPDDGGAAR